MVNSFDAYNVEALTDVVSDIQLVHVAVHRQAVPLRSSSGEHCSKLFRRIGAFIGVEPDADNRVFVWKRLEQRCHRILCRVITEDAQDQLAADAEKPTGIEESSTQSADHRVERDAPRGVRLRVEEDLRIPDVCGGCLLQIGPGEIVKVPRGLEYRHGIVIDRQKRR